MRRNHRPHQLAQKLVHRRSTRMPPPYHHQVLLRIHPDRIRPEPHRRERLLRKRRPCLPSRIQPPKKSVVRFQRRRRNRPPDPILGDHALPVPNALSQHEQTEPRLVHRADPKPAAPPRPGRNRLHLPPVEIDERIVVAQIPPGGRRPDWIHHLVLQNLGQRLLEIAQQRKRQPVDPHVVVFVPRPRRLHFARPHPPVAEFLLVQKIRRLLEQSSYPLARLRKV